MDNEELHLRLAALRLGDKSAFEEIYDGMKTPMYTIILRITQDKSLVEDILQEVFVKLYRSPPEPSKNPRAYLFQMARNLALDGLRKQTQFVDIEDVADATHAPDDDIPQRLDIDDAINTLSLTERQIVVLRINGGLKFREISAALGIPLGTAIWKYHAAIERLRNILSGGEI